MARTLGEALKAARERTGLSQSAVARQAKIDASVLSNIEGGRRSNLRFETVARIAQVLGVSLDTLALECGYKFVLKREESIATDLTRAIELLSSSERGTTVAQKQAAQARRILASLAQPRRRR